jgi:hypothetical protein
MGGGKLPYDAEIEYLEGTGTQWIDTGIIFDTTKHGYIIDATLINDKPGVVTICGNWEGSAWNLSNLSCVINGNYLSCYFMCPPPNFRGGKMNGVLSSPNVRSVVGFINHGLSNGVINITRYVNGVSSSITMSDPYIGTSLQTFPIFGVKARGLNDVIEIPHLKLYGFKMYNGDIIILDLIPVRVGQVGYMYDKVSKQLFGNAGTGAFILGPDK